MAPGQNSASPGQISASLGQNSDAPGWISVAEALPADGQRVLAFVPGNVVHLPGKDGSTELREVLLLRFCANFFAADPAKRDRHGLHFWSGEGTSNRYFAEVSHWMQVPPAPTP